jgi:hypothetical protein
VFATSHMSIQDQFTTPILPYMFSSQSLFDTSLDETLNSDLEFSRIFASRDICIQDEFTIPTSPCIMSSQLVLRS